MKKIVLILFAVTVCVIGFAAERHVYRDSSGRITVTATLNMPHMPTIMPTLPR